MLKVIEGTGDQPNSDEFIIPASDTKGHSARCWFRTVPSMLRQVQQILDSKAFPYRTKGDIFRHALHRHMRWLNSIEPIPSVAGQVDAILEIMRDEEFHNDFALVFDKMGERISQHMANGSEAEARRLVLLVNTHIKGMPGGYWREKYQKELMARYGHLLRNAPKASMCELNDE